MASQKNWTDRVREFWEKLGEVVDELVGAPQPELVPVPVRNRPRVPQQQRD